MFHIYYNYISKKSEISRIWCSKMIPSLSSKINISRHVSKQLKHTNPIELHYEQSRHFRFVPKKLFFPTIKKKYKHPEQKKEHEFSEDTLHSLSHGEDWVVKIRTSEFSKKHKYRSHPERYVMRMWSDILDMFLWLPVSKLALRRIHQAGYFKNIYILYII